MSAQAHVPSDIPVIPYEIFPPLDVETQRASTLLKELKSEEPDTYHIAPVGLYNFLYNAAHLFLPYFYSSRAYPVLSSATWTEQEIKSQFARTASKDSGVTLKHWPHVKQSWTEFLDSLSNEWKTLNLVSALLLTAIYNVLQLGGQGNNLTQCTALMSLLSALMSLLFGCLYLIRFETMRRAYKAIQWSSDVLMTSQTVFWNIYILLALPSVWLAWSLIFFIVCLMSIVWQPIDKTIGSTSGLGPLQMATKITVSALLLIGMAHLSLALFTFARYGSRLDNTWRKKLEDFSAAIPPDAEANSKSSSFEDSRPSTPNSHLLPSPNHLLPSPYVARAGTPNGGPPYSYLQSSPYPLRLPSPHDFDNSRPPYSHLQSSPYPLRLPPPHDFDNGRPPYSYLQSSPYPLRFPPPHDFDNGRPPYSHLQSSPYPLRLPPPHDFDNGRPPYSRLQSSPNPLLPPPPHDATVGSRRPLNNGRPPYSHLQSSPHPLLPPPHDTTVGSRRPFNNGRLPYSHLQSSPYPFLPSPHDTTVGSRRPPYSHLQSSPYPFLPSPYVARVDEPFNNGRPSDHSRPLNRDESRPMNNSGHIDNDGLQVDNNTSNVPVNNSRPFNDSDRRTLNSTMVHPRPWARLGPVTGRHSDFIPRPPSAP